LLFLVVWAGALGCARSESLSQRYAPYGQLIVTQLAAAPFPHPGRADGHKYKEEVYSAKEHYSDSTVAIFIPKGLRDTGRIDFVVHFHGWRNHVEGVLEQYKLIEQMAQSRRNAVLVVPQGPRDAPDSFGGKLEDPGGFQRFMAEVLANLRQQTAGKWKEFDVGNIVLSAHSGGYQAAAACLDRGGLTPHITEVWLFDALYAETDKFLAWFDHGGSRFIDLYTEHGGTKEQTQQLMATLKERGTPLVSGQEGEINAADLRAGRAVFLYSRLPHNDVLDKHQTFVEFLKTSGLAETQ